MALPGMTNQIATKQAGATLNRGPQQGQSSDWGSGPNWKDPRGGGGDYSGVGPLSGGLASISKDRPWEYTFTGSEVTDRSGTQFGQGPNGYGYYDLNSPDSVALGAQEHYTKEFKNNMPQMGNDIYNQVAQQQNSVLGQSLKGAKQAASHRGLLYSGIEAGHEGAIRGNAAANLAGQKSSINQGLMDAYSGMAKDRISAGLQFQHQQQQMQNAIYEQAMAKLASENAMAGQVGAAAGAGIGFAYGGPTGAYIGSQAGGSAGKAIY